MSVPALVGDTDTAGAEPDCATGPAESLIAATVTTTPPTTAINTARTVTAMANRCRRGDNGCGGRTQY
jgi:hypothetical protein